MSMQTKRSVDSRPTYGIYGDNVENTGIASPSKGVVQVVCNDTIVHAFSSSTPRQNIPASNVTTGKVLTIDDANALTTGRILDLVSNSSSTAQRTLVEVNNDHASATGTVVMRLRNDSTNSLLEFNRDGYGIGGFKIIKVEKTHTSDLFDASATTDTATIYTANENEVVMSAKIVLDTKFAAPSMTALNVIIGTAGDDDGYVEAGTMNLIDDAAGSEYSTRGALWDTAGEGAFVIGGDNWVAKATATGANLSATTAGKISIYLLVFTW